MANPAEERRRVDFEDAEDLMRYLRDDGQPDYLRFVGDGDFGQAWLAWEDEQLYFTSESGLRIQNQSAFLFAQECLDADTYTLTPVNRSAVEYLDELVSSIRQG
jgi:cellulase/cellobiase CelA1